MRPLHLTFAPATEDADGIANDATGAASSITLAATGAGDGLAHKLIFASTANLSGIDLTITGTDADGVAQTEVIAGPSNNTVTTTNYFLTWTTITKSATFGANTMDAGWADEFVTPTIGLNTWAQAANFETVRTGTIDYTVQQTLSELRTRAEDGPFNWTDIPAGLADAVDLIGITISAAWRMAPPPRGMRLKGNSYSAGAVLDFYAVHQGT